MAFKDVFSDEDIAGLVSLADSLMGAPRGWAPTVTVNPAEKARRAAQPKAKAPTTKAKAAPEEPAPEVEPGPAAANVQTAVDYQDYMDSVHASDPANTAGEAVNQGLSSDIYNDPTGLGVAFADAGVAQGAAANGGAAAAGSGSGGPGDQGPGGGHGTGGSGGETGQGGYRKGGLVKEATAPAHRDEYVLTAKETKFIGVDNLERLAKIAGSSGSDDQKWKQVAALFAGKGTRLGRMVA